MIEHEIERSPPVGDEHRAGEESGRARRRARAPTVRHEVGDAHAHRRGTSTPSIDGVRSGSTTSTSARASPACSRSTASRAASPPCTTTARIASPSAAATAASAPASISRWSTNGPTTPSTPSSSDRGGVGARLVQLLLHRVGARTCTCRVALCDRANALRRRRAWSPAVSTASCASVPGSVSASTSASSDASSLRSPTCVGDERLDHAHVGGRRELALEAASLLADERSEATAALAQRLHAHQPVGDAFVAERGERVLGVEHGVVERAQTRAQLAVARVEVGALVAQALEARLEAGDLVAGEVELDRAELGATTAVLLRGLGLALERCELAPHLAQQVVEAQEVALGRDEATLGAFLALAELQDPRRLLDDARGGRPATS